jgi:hypothetical protein
VKAKTDCDFWHMSTEIDVTGHLGEERFAVTYLTPMIPNHNYWRARVTFLQEVFNGRCRFTGPDRLCPI